MAKGKRKLSTSKSETFPWLPLLLFLASIYIFWVLPRQLGSQPPKVQFESAR
jgi:hypothetical protein